MILNINNLGGEVYNTKSSYRNTKENFLDIHSYKNIFF
jgi:hypothetical protein